MNILIVEDELKIAEQLRKGLQREGYSVSVRHDGQAALDLVRATEFDLLILDWMLPKVDGQQVARKLRLAKIETPILMLTARDASSDIVEGLDSGADDYLTKPFAFDVLLARLRALARRGPPTHVPLLQVADLMLDPGAHRASRAGEEITLSQREFDLLHFLMLRAERVIARSAIIEAVWGYGSRIENNTLDVFIRLLRNKVDAGHDTKLIQTVRGVGYCLSEKRR